MLVALLMLPVLAAAKTVFPIHYGLKDAKTDVARYEVLLKTHQAAVENGWDVSYAGIGSIVIEIPRGAKSIPLTWNTDFGGVTLTVRNTQKKMTLFTLENGLTEVGVTKENIGKGRFKDVKALKKGTKLLVIQDETPWVKQRKGYNYGATRMDVMLLKCGKARNNVVASYSDTTSQPKCYYSDVTGQKVVIKNLRFIRTEDSKYITHLIGLKNLNDVTLKNISVTTPQGGELYGDVVFGMQNCTNVTMEDVTIEGTYSQGGKFGYGIQMNNVWNSRFVRVKAWGNWGVFGNNNVNHAVLEDCDINRFDIHCYGRDVYCYRTLFKNGYNQFSSLMGELVYEDCVFERFTPVLFEQSYAAYTPFELRIKHCKIKDATALISAGNMGARPEGTRAELQNLSWPNIMMEDVEVRLPEGVSEWTLFKVNGKALEEAGYISQVKMKDVNVIAGTTGKTVSIRFSNNQAKTREKLRVEIKGSSVDRIEL